MMQCTCGKCDGLKVAIFVRGLTRDELLRFGEAVSSVLLSCPACGPVLVDFMLNDLPNAGLPLGTEPWTK